MKTIAILTINDYDNLGNRLQNYAVQTILTSYGDTITLEKNDHKINKRRGLKAFIRRCLSKIKRIIKRIFGMSKKEPVSVNFAPRHNNFIEFNKFIRFGKEITIHNYDDINNSYDYFVVGSDQIWNPNFQPNQYVNFLEFADQNKRIALAPSIANNALTDKQKEGIRKGALGFKYLSCREEQGSKLLRELTNKECTSLIDPTLMLPTSEWDKVSKKPSFHDDSKKYILLYFLGEMTEEYKNIINNISTKYNLEIINIYDKNNIYYSCGPSEFIYLISHCEIMLTDSFHGSVFSYIYNKPFRIFERVNGMSMNSRLINLINVLHLDNLYINKDTNIDNILEVHYDKTYLENEQKKFKDYLDMCFNKER